MKAKNIDKIPDHANLGVGRLPAQYPRDGQFPNHSSEASIKENQGANAQLNIWSDPIERLSQSFTVLTGGVLSEVRLNLKTEVSFVGSGSLFVKLYTDTGGDPDSGTLLGTSDPVDPADVTSGLQTFTFSTTIPVVPESYFAVLEFVGTATTLGIAARGTTSGGYTGGEFNFTITTGGGFSTESFIVDLFQVTIWGVVTELQAQIFTPAVTGNVFESKVNILRVGNPTGQLVIDIYTDTGGDPDSGVLQGTSDPVDIATITGGGVGGALTTFSFSSAAPVSSGTPYWMVCRISVPGTFGGGDRLFLHGGLAPNVELETTSSITALLQLDDGDGFGIQTITANATGTVPLVEIRLHKANSPVADMFLEIRENDGIQDPGVSGQVLIATSFPFAAASLPPAATFVSFTFAAPFNLTDNEDYSVAVKYTNVTTINATDRVIWSGDTSNDYPDGELWESAGVAGGTSLDNYPFVGDIGVIDSEGDGWAQSFLAPATGDLDSVTMAFRKIGSPTGHFRMRLYTDTGGDPDAGTLLAISDPFDVGAFSGNGVDHVFDWISTPAVVSATSYWLTIVADGTSQLLKNAFLAVFEDENDLLAQSWNQEYSASINAITVTFQKNGTPTGNMFLDIYTNIGGDPDSGSLVGTSDAFDMTTVTGGGINEKDFIFSTPLAISAGGYWMVCRAAAGNNLSGANRFAIWGGSGVSTPVGEDWNWYNDNGGGWQDPVNQDWFFKIKDTDLFLDGSNDMHVKGTLANNYADGHFEREDGFGWDSITGRDISFDITVLGGGGPAPPVQSDPDWDAGVRIFTTPPPLPSGFNSYDGGSWEDFTDERNWAHEVTTNESILAVWQDPADQDFGFQISILDFGSGWAGTIQSFLLPAQGMEDVLDLMLTQRGLANAEGLNMDRLGEIVGEDRQGRTDPTYAVGIVAQIAANNSDTTARDLLTIAELILGDDLVQLTLHEVFPAKAVVDYLSEIQFTVNSANNSITIQENDGVSPVLPATLPDGDYFPYELATIISGLVEVELGAPLVVSFTAERTYQFQLDNMGLTNPSITFVDESGPLFGFAVSQVITGTVSGDPVAGPESNAEGTLEALLSAKAGGVDLTVQTTPLGAYIGFSNDPEALGWGTLVGGITIGGGTYATIFT